jgi:hypothetical protein
MRLDQSITTSSNSISASQCRSFCGASSQPLATLAISSASPANRPPPVA